VKKSTPRNLLACLLFLICIPATAQLGNLTVEKGQVRSIPPRLYKYDTIRIKQNAVLKVNNNGSKWLVLNANVIICDGTIEYMNFKRGAGSVSFTLEGGETIEHTFTEGSGGAGGSGSGNNYKQGGTGYSSSDHNGGGGGAGAYLTGTPRVNIAGASATDFRGASSPGGSSSCFGGNGARQTFGHGGLICIVAGKITFGKGAKILLNGSNGANGAAGGKGDCYDAGSRYYWGGGGGGGGTSGGNGGVLIVKCNNVINMPVVQVNPGKGGKGGAGGKSVRCDFNGQAGTKGDDGEQGYADWQ